MKYYNPIIGAALYVGLAIYGCVYENTHLVILSCTMVLAHYIYHHTIRVDHHCEIQHQKNDRQYELNLLNTELAERKLEKIITEHMERK